MTDGAVEVALDALAEELEDEKMAWAMSTLGIAGVLSDGALRLPMFFRGEVRARSRSGSTSVSSGPAWSRPASSSCGVRRRGLYYEMSLSSTADKLAAISQSSSFNRFRMVMR